jgi:hypothetical protein
MESPTERSGLERADDPSGDTGDERARRVDEHVAAESQVATGVDVKRRNDADREVELPRTAVASRPSPADDGRR